MEPLVMKYEYMTVNKTRSMYVMEMNELGRDGWRLVSVNVYENHESAEFDFEGSHLRCPINVKRFMYTFVREIVE